MENGRNWRVPRLDIIGGLRKVFSEETYAHPSIDPEEMQMLNTEFGENLFADTEDSGNVAPEQVINVHHDVFTLHQAEPSHMNAQSFTTDVFIGPVSTERAAP